ncbi:MAG: hypothetical protein IPJ69_05165 [Deltaproteobacteria bacterium]|nr:MAG: hypothetical protein IPJ69_05165 [Deltaproteobacteria bacterium]
MNIKKISLILLFGFMFGAVIAGLVSPAMISWYFDPPAAMGVSCKAAVVWGLGAYQKILIIGGVMGLVAAGVLLIVQRFKKIPLEKGSPESLEK